MHVPHTADNLLDPLVASPADCHLETTPRTARELLSPRHMKYPTTTDQLPTIDDATLATTCGGMQWEKMCASYNVEDRRPGAGTRAQQRARTDQWNRENGCPTWADLHPRPPRRR